MRSVAVPIALLAVSGCAPLVQGQSTATNGPASLVLVAITPCRVMDTRTGSGFTGPFGAPSLAAGQARSVPIPRSRCGIPAAAAYELNFALIPPAGASVGYLSAWPDNQPWPGTVVSNDTLGGIVSNSAIVAAGSDGGIQVLASNPTDLVIDVSGYYVLPGSVGGSNTGLFNVALGDGALKVNTSGQENTAIGQGALGGNTTGNSNTAIGNIALIGNTTGFFNTATGSGALTSNTVGSSNTAMGATALFLNTTGSSNTATGYGALNQNTTGGSNTATGIQALNANLSGCCNTAVGESSLAAATEGNYNTAVGYQAGTNLLTGTFDVYIANSGRQNESYTIRIGDSNEKMTFISGIRGTTTTIGDAVPVVIDSTGQLGTVSSSLRVKRDIEAMPDTTDTIMRLRPVEFRYTSQGEDAPRQYGLIAEEVGEIAPELVAHNAKGEVETVYYDKVNAMLLRVVQEQQRAIEELKARVASLENGSPER